MKGIFVALAIMTIMIIVMCCVYKNETKRNLMFDIWFEIIDPVLELITDSFFDD